MTEQSVSLVRGNKQGFINPFTDFSFKHLFGREATKEQLIDFLNGVFEGRKKIVDLKYGNGENKGPGKDYRKTIFDNTVFYQKLNYIFIEMPKFNRKEEALKTRQDEWLFILKNLNSLKEIPLSLSNKEQYIKFFDAAALGNLNPEEMNAYQQSLKIQRDNYAVEQAAIKQGLAKGLKMGLKEGKLKGKLEGKLEGKKEGKLEGMKEGKLEGKLEGKYEKALEIAREMKKDGEHIDKIIRYTELTEKEIKDL